MDKSRFSTKRQKIFLNSSRNWVAKEHNNLTKRFSRGIQQQTGLRRSELKDILLEIIKSEEQKQKRIKSYESL